jgi:hypothetical protein
MLAKGFLFRSPFDRTFFVNIRFLFNGDRLAFVKGLSIKETKPFQRLCCVAVPKTDRWAAIHDRSVTS